MEPTPVDDATGSTVELRCRVCLETDVNEMISLFCVASTQKKLLAHMTLAVAGVPISMCDKMPQVVCDKCLGNLDVAYACWRRCRESWGDYVRDPALKDKEEDFRCRICLRSNVEELISVYCICDSQLLKINEMVKQYSGVEVKENDGHPQYICEACLSELNIGFDFRKLCRQSNVKLRLELQAKEAAAAPARVDSDDESLPEAERTSPAPEPSRAAFKKIAKRRQSVSKMMAKPELAAGVKVKRLDIPEVVPGSFKKKVFSSPSEFKELTNEILSKPKEPPPKPPVAAKPSTSKKTFSSPSEFKKLANQIMDKSPKKPQEPPSSLVAFEIRVLTDSEHYTHSEISSFKCSRCRTRNPLSTIGVTCVKCGSAFDNYLIVMPHKGKSSMTAYCCIECNYFAITLTTIVSHIGKHQKPAAVPASKPKPPIVMRKLVVPIVPIVMKEETVEAPQIEDEQLPDPLETVFVPGTMSNGAKRANEDPEPEPEVQSKKLRKNSSAETMEVLLEMKEPESISDAETISSVESVPKTPPSSVARKTIDADRLFDTLLDVTHYKMLYLQGALCCGCLKLFLTQDALNRHQAKCPKSSDPSCAEQILAVKRVFYYCNICPQLLLKHDFESHRVEQHPTIVVKSPSNTNLLVTKQTPSGWATPLKLTSGDPTIFKTLAETAQYRLLLLQGLRCCGCWLVFPSAEQLLLHRAEKHPAAAVSARFRCGQCQENCRSEPKLTRHELDGGRKLYYACKLCQGMLLDSGNDFEEHRIQNHPKVEMARTPSEQQPLLVEKIG